MKKFKLINEFSGYSNKADVTNIDPSFLIPPSQNVLINDGEKIVNRPGYSLYGASATALTPIVTSCDWLTSTGTEINIRSYDDELEFYYSGAWRRIKDGFSSVDFSFTTVWDSTEKLDLLLFANGDANMRMWTGAVTTFASATVNTITKEGSGTWAASRFLKNGTRSVTIGGTDYAYTGGESTTTLTGVTPDPTAAGHAVGAVVTQTIRTTANTPASGFNNNILSTLKNQVYVGDYTRRDVYVSKNSSYTDFTFTSPTRLPGEGTLLTLDQTPIGFVSQEEDMYLATVDGWFKTEFTLSADLTGESFRVQKLKTTPLKGLYGRDSMCNVLNDVVYVTKDKTIDTLGRIQNINTPSSKPLSDPIKLELLDYDYTIAPHLKFHQNKLYATFPSEGKTLIYDFEKKYWNPPQLLPVRRFAIISNDLYGHSSAVPETYKLFDTSTYADNTNPIESIAAFAYNNYGNRAWGKAFNEWYTEGYIKSNTILEYTSKFDFGGFGGISSFDIDGSDTDILFSTTTDNSLGKWPLGHLPLGSITDSISNLSKFRIINEIKDVDFYEHSPVYSTNAVDYQWEIIAFGGNAELSVSDNQPIKQ